MRLMTLTFETTSQQLCIYAHTSHRTHFTVALFWLSLHTFRSLQWHAMEFLRLYLMFVHHTRKKRETELDTVLNKRVHKLLSVCSVDHLDDVGLFSFLLRLFFSVQSAIRAGVN